MHESGSRNQFDYFLQEGLGISSLARTSIHRNSFRNLLFDAHIMYYLYNIIPLTRASDTSCPGVVLILKSVAKM